MWSCLKEKMKGSVRYVRLGLDISLGLCSISSLPWALSPNHHPEAELKSKPEVKEIGVFF